MVYLIDAVAFGFMAAIWSKSGGPNILVALTFAVLTVINAVLSAPLLLKLPFLSGLI